MQGLQPVYQNNSSNVDRAMQFGNQAKSAAGSMQPNIPEPGKTAGGAAMAGLGGAAAGASISTAILAGATSGSAAGPWGAGIGAAVGLGAYLLS